MKTLLLFILFTGTAMADENSERIIKLFNDLRKDNLQILDGFYDPQVKFVDPLGKIQSRKDIKAYYKNLYQNVTSIRFEFDEIIGSNNNYSAPWVMYLKAKNLNNEEEIAVSGVSVIKFREGKGGLVYYHRDYFDMGEFIYQHVPILGFIIRKVNDKLKH
jgi:hypothetical protein